MGRKSCSRAAELMRRSQGSPAHRLLQLVLREPADEPVTENESVSHFYPATGRHVADDGGYPVGRDGGIPAIAGIGLAPS